LANEVLYLNKKLSAQDAMNAKFVNAVYKKDDLMPKTLEVAKTLAASPVGALLDSKKVLTKLSFTL
jgi:enoyl-CoA hydratase/carnithine racemase